MVRHDFSSSKGDEHHLTELFKMIQKNQEAGYRTTKKKPAFFHKEKTWLKCKIMNKYKTNKKTKAILELKQPKLLRKLKIISRAVR